MYYIYLIKSQKNPKKIYVGYTTNLKERLKKHNEGGSIFTSNYKPWELITCICFKNKGKALKFETYLKSHSGRIFAEKRLW
ncbi:GIY-YIG nuclease family protein [Candidatus Babeliales bacterium]|nr:GIY-YIG nuclease family protein [Candidatus Babeliales bacterium]